MWSSLAPQNISRIPGSPEVNLEAAGPHQGLPCKGEGAFCGVTFVHKRVLFIRSPPPTQQHPRTVIQILFESRWKPPPGLSLAMLRSQTSESKAPLVQSSCVLRRKQCNRKWEEGAWATLERKPVLLRKRPQPQISHLRPRTSVHAVLPHPLRT